MDQNVTLYLVDKLGFFTQEVTQPIYASLPAERYTQVSPPDFGEFITPKLVNNEWVAVSNAQEERNAVIAAEIEAKRIASIPIEISPRQIRQALSRAGLRNSVEAAVATGDQDTKDWWEFATTFERGHPRVLAMAQALDVTEVQMDDLWTLAGSL